MQHLHYLTILFLTSSYSLSTFSLLSLKRFYFLFRTEIIILNPKFGIYIVFSIYIYICIHLCVRKKSERVGFSDDGVINV